MNSLIVLTLCLVSAFSLSASADNFQIERASVRHESAPWDGPGIAIYLAAGEKVCDAKVTPPHVRIAIWKNAQEIPHQKVVLPDQKLGSVYQVRADNSTERLSSGWVRITKADERTGVEGEYDLRFADGEHRKGKFKGEWCAGG